MTRERLHFVATLAVNGIGVGVVAGILYALILGQEYHPLVVMAAFIFLLLRPLLLWIEGCAEKNTSETPQ